MTSQPIAWPVPHIDAARCIGCGVCEQVCPTEAVEVRDGMASIVRPAACTFCDRCERSCPHDAIGRPFAIVFAPASHTRTDPSNGVQR